MDWNIKTNKTVQETVYHVDLTPGPELYVLPKKGFNKKYAIFSTRFGSIDNNFWMERRSGGGQAHGQAANQAEELSNVKEQPIGGQTGEQIEVPDGVAHFLEHKLFDDEEGNVFDRFAQYGASSNAFTGFTNTTYLFSCTDFFPENFELLLDFVQSPYFTKESVDKEQGIIQQEIRMYEDNPEWRVFFDLLEALYHSHPVRNDIAGTIESISKITEETLYKCYHTFYHPSNMAIFVTGDVEPEDVLEQVKRNLSGRSIPPADKIKRYLPEESRSVKEKKVVQKLSVSQPIFNMGFKDTYSFLEGRDLLFRELSLDLLLEMIFGRSEELYTELYEAGLLDEHFSADYTGEMTYGFTLLGGRSKDPEKLVERIWQGLEKVKEKGLSPESFSRHKRAMRGDFLRSFNSLEFIANNYLAYRFREIDFFDVLDVLEEVNLEDLERILHEHLREDLHAVSIITPFDD
jgi:predicted Zn-dependent peptidase